MPIYNIRILAQNEKQYVVFEHLQCSFLTFPLLTHSCIDTPLLNLDTLAQSRHRCRRHRRPPPPPRRPIPKRAPGRRLGGGG